MPTPLRELRPQAVAIILMSISIVTLIFLGEIFELFSNKKEPLELVKRDGSTIEFTLPWRHLVNNVEAASSDQASGSNLEPELTKGTAIPDALENDRSKLVSVDVSEGINVVSIVASILNEGSAVLNVVVENGDGEEDLAASPTVGSSTISTTLSSEPGGSHTPLTSTPTDIQQSSSSDCRNSSPNYQLPSPPANKISPQTVSNGSPPLFKLNLTITPSFSSDMVPSSIGTPLQFLPPIPTACPPVVTPTCPEHVTFTCYVTETWHSTHYESTATFFSFMSAITITEIISFGSNTTTLHASPVPSRSFPNTNHTCSARCAQNSANPVNTESSVVLGSGGSYSYSSTRPISALFTNFLTVSLPPKVNPQVSSNLLPTIRCADGSLEFLVEDCLFGFPSSSLLAFRTNSLLGESTTFSFSGAETAFPVASHTAAQGPFGALGGLGTGSGCLTSCFPDQTAATSLPSSSDGKVVVGAESFIARLASVLGSIPGLNGGLLSTVIAIISSGANELPTSGLDTLATSTDVGTSIVGHGNVEITSLNGGLEGGNVFSTAVSGVTAGVGSIGLNGGLGDIGAAGSGVLKAATGNTNNVIGNGNLFPTAASNANLVFGASAGNQPTIAGATQVTIENEFPGLGLIRNIKHDVETSTGILLVPPESLKSDIERKVPRQPNIPSNRPLTLSTTIIISPSPSGSLSFVPTSNTIESLR
ncbi:hypothetical protein B0O99DRAFT_704995 [Bisporella sp. PMI_857]|nr:hypothetical protein B0O99DRAFT_704995 [Bisporella sp. PMI_857]